MRNNADLAIAVAFAAFPGYVQRDHCLPWQVGNANLLENSSTPCNCIFESIRCCRRFTDHFLSDGKDVLRLKDNVILAKKIFPVIEKIFLIAKKIVSMIETIFSMM
jgi:hypothetical protein